MLKTIFPALLLLGIFTVFGCGRGVEREQVQGTVTFDGQPVPFGEILFQPTEGPAGSAVIRDGKYDTAGEEGLGVMAGPHKLLITAYEFEPVDLDNVDETSENADAAGPTPLFVNYEMTTDLSGGTHDITVPGDAKGFGIGNQETGEAASGNEP